ncbi:hypothetical protein BDW71DRAFT_212292 [Aspergillus fruticulosus]
MVGTVDPDTQANPLAQNRSTDYQKSDRTTAGIETKYKEKNRKDDDEDEGVEDGEEGEDEEDEEDEEDDEEDDDKQSVDLNPVHTELQGIVKSIKSFEIKDWSEHAKIFGKKAARWSHLEDVSEKTGDSILHLLMKDDDANAKQNKEMGKAIKYIAKYHPRLLTVQNKEKMTPLYAALTALDRHRAVRIKRGLFPSKLSKKAEGYLAKAIGTQCGPRNENCLHLALKSDQFRDSALLDLLVRHASPDAINARDNRNWTPLHRAVHYRHSGEDSFKIIRELIARGEPCPEPHGGLDASQSKCAFDAYVTLNGEQLSVYEFHMKTRDRERTLAVSNNPTKAIDRKEPNKGEQKVLDAGEKQTEDPKKAAASQQRTNPRERTNNGGARMPAEVREGIREEDSPKPGLARANTSSLRRTDGGAKVNSSAESRKKNAKLEPEVDLEEERNHREVWSGKILEELKLHCLRTRPISKAARFLYGSNKQGIQLYFNYSGLPTENADPITFYDNFRTTRFDEVLKYVEFPAVRLKKGDIPRGETFQQHKILFQSKSGGRKDLLFFFSWLKDKKVKHIINLVVHEDVDPHDDEVIQTCLSMFRIDSLDWSKPDLDPEMLCSALGEVNELHLHWGGNNAILRAWGEPEGLRALKGLEKIHLYHDEVQPRSLRFIPTSYVLIRFLVSQTSERSQRNIAKFAAREGFELAISASGIARMDDRHGNNKSMIVLTASEVEPHDEQPQDEPKPPIKVLIGQSQAHATVRGAAETTFKEAVPGQPTVTVHRWLESIDNFTDQLRTLMATIRAKSHKGDEVRVALLDDGVDFCEKEFRERVMDGRSFAYFDDAKQREKQWYVSELGHGTVMAHMILRVCPMAKIYPIRLDTIQNPRKNHVEIRSQSAIQAIEAAVENDVHIISMSWTVQQPTGKEKLAFDEALGKAELNGILMFCSSADEGQYSGDHYPTAWGPQKFFRIGASQADGNPYSRVLVKQVDYLFPGVDVVRANRRDINLRILEDKIAFTGSSVSTALAAGLAALVLWFVIIGAKYSQDENLSDGLDYTDVKRMRDIKEMKEAFQKLGASQNPNEKFVEIWSVLERPTQSLKEHRGHFETDIKESRRIIFNLARNLVNKS